MTSRFLGSMVWGSCSHHVLLTGMQQGSKWQVRSRNMTAVLQMHINLPAWTHNKPCWETILYAYISGICLAFRLQRIFVKLLGGPQAWGMYTFKWLTLLSDLFVVKLLWSKKTESKEHCNGSQMPSGEAHTAGRAHRHQVTTPAGSFCVKAPQDNHTCFTQMLCILIFILHKFLI